MKQQLNIFISFTLFSFFSLSCNQNSKVEKPIPSQSDNISAHAQLSASSPGNAVAPAATTAPANTPQSAGNTTANVAVNPQHGQPGHRCDLPVGAPLSSSPKAVKQLQTASQVQIVSPNTPAPAKPAANNTALLNPQHGQPGHRCDIQVGAPLPEQPVK